MAFNLEKKKIPLKAFKPTAEQRQADLKADSVPLQPQPGAEVTLSKWFVGKDVAEVEKQANEFKRERLTVASQSHMQVVAENGRSYCMYAEVVFYKHNVVTEAREKDVI